MAVSNAGSASTVKSSVSGRMAVDEQARAERADERDVLEERLG